jgi:hypothetical protein
MGWLVVFLFHGHCMGNYYAASKFAYSKTIILVVQHAILFRMWVENLCKQMVSDKTYSIIIFFIFFTYWIVIHSRILANIYRIYCNLFFIINFIPWVLNKLKVLLGKFVQSKFILAGLGIREILISLEAVKRLLETVSMMIFKIIK